MYTCITYQSLPLKTIRYFPLDIFFDEVNGSLHVTQNPHGVRLHIKVCYEEGSRQNSRKRNPLMLNPNTGWQFTLYAMSSPQPPSTIITTRGTQLA